MGKDHHDLGDGKYEVAPEGKFCSPSGIAIDSQDGVYVTDFSNDRVQIFTLEGKEIYNMLTLIMWGNV